jgi:hypothetical protein
MQTEEVEDGMLLRKKSAQETTVQEETPVEESSYLGSTQTDSKQNLVQEEIQYEHRSAEQIDADTRTIRRAHLEESILWCETHMKHPEKSRNYNELRRRLAKLQEDARANKKNIATQVSSTKDLTNRTVSQEGRQMNASESLSGYVQME